MKKLLGIVGVLLVLMINIASAQTNTIPTQTIFETIQNGWEKTGGIISYIVMVAIVIGIIILRKNKELEDLKSKWRFLKTITILSILSQQTFAQTSIHIDDMNFQYRPESQWVIGIMIIVMLGIVLGGVCYCAIKRMVHDE